MKSSAQNGVQSYTKEWHTGAWQRAAGPSVALTGLVQVPKPVGKAALGAVGAVPVLQPVAVSTEMRGNCLVHECSGLWVNDRCFNNITFNHFPAKFQSPVQDCRVEHPVCL